MEARRAGSPFVSFTLDRIIPSKVTKGKTKRTALSGLLHLVIRISRDNHDEIECTIGALVINYLYLARVSPSSAICALPRRQYAAEY